MLLRPRAAQVRHSKRGCLMNSECLRIADQLRRAFSGDPWHGPPLRDLLDGITSGQSLQRPLTSGHAIHELVLPIHGYLRVRIEAAQGVPMPDLFGTQEDWPVPDRGEEAWNAAQRLLFELRQSLAKTIAGMVDA